MFPSLTTEECIARDEPVWAMYYDYCYQAINEEEYHDFGYRFHAVWALVAFASGHCGPNGKAMVSK